MGKVFVSYNHSDGEFVQSIVTILQAQDIDVWVDWQDIPAGYPWREAIFEGVIKADIFLMFISSSYISSDICRMETFLARSYGKRIVPFMLEDCLSELPNHRELKGLEDLAMISYAIKKFVGLDLSDEKLFQMLVDCLKNPYQDLPEYLLYIAYPSAAALYATTIAKDLDAANYPTWISTLNTHIGYDWQQEQWSAMMKARAILVVLNENTPASEHIHREILFARTRRLPILPIVAPNTNIALMRERFEHSWEMRLVSEINWLEPVPNYESMLEQLKVVVQKILSN